jgi:hypothetical protein
MTANTAFGVSTPVNSRSINNAFDAVLNNGYDFGNITATGNIKVNTNDYLSPYQGFRNKIINGNMRIHQRGGSTIVTSSNLYNVDRWYGFSSGTFVMQQSTDVPAGTNLSNSLWVQVAIADASLAAGDFNSIAQRIEGYDSAVLGYGTANQPNTLSFWVKSSLTGTYCVSFRNSGVDRSYVAEYTINSANTWEKKVISLTTDIAGTWLKTDGIGLRLDFALAMGTNFQTTPNVWASGSFTATSNQVNWMSSASSRTFYLTGVQLEQGSVATPLEQRPQQTELALCQRYFYNPSTVYNTTFMSMNTNQFGEILTWAFPVTMRAVPTVVQNFVNADNTVHANTFLYNNYLSIRVYPFNTGFAYGAFSYGFNVSAEL